MIAGARSVVAIAEWAAETPPVMLAKLGVTGDSPCESTIRRTLNKLDADGLDVIFGTWAALLESAGAQFPGDRCGRQVGPRIHPGRWQVPASVVGVDPRRRTGSGPTRRRCEDQRNPLVRKLLDNVELLGALVTADAMHCQKTHAKYLVEQRGAHYLLTVKGNQPALRQRPAQLPWAQVQPADTQDDRGHGRVKSRTIKVVSIDAGILFPHAAQAMQITRRTRRFTSRKWRTETVYAVTDPSASHATGRQLGGWLRGHWSIENKLHWVRDVTFAQDLSQARTGSGPQVMATLRNLAMRCSRFCGLEVKPQAR